jgi:hypothetical protein
METFELLVQIKNELTDMKKNLLQMPNPTGVSDKWIPRSKVMEFLNYGATQMAAFEKNEEIIVTKVGKRVFINRESLTRFLDNNQTKKQTLR